QEGPPSAESIALLIHRATELLRDRDPRARDLLEKAVQYCPENSGLRALLAQALLSGGDRVKALAVYEGLMCDFPESLPAKVNTAIVLLKLGRAAAARP